MKPSYPASRNRCCVCGKQTRTHPGIKLHLFPRDHKKRQQWLRTLNISFMKDTQSICQEHFDPKYISSAGRLVQNAVPIAAEEVYETDPFDEDRKPVTKDVGTDMLQDGSTNTTVKLPQYDSFGTDFGMVPNPCVSEAPNSPQPREEISLHLSPQPEHTMTMDDDDVSEEEEEEDPLTPHPQPLTKPIASDADTDSKGNKCTTGTPRIIVRRLHYYFTDVEMVAIAQGVEKRTDVILGKFDDKNTISVRKIAWEEVTKEVNEVSRVKKSPGDVSEKFELMRVALKKKLSAFRKDIKDKNYDPAAASQCVLTEWEKILLRLPGRPTNNVTQNTRGKSLPSTSGTVKKSDQTTSVGGGGGGGAQSSIEEESNHDNNSFGDDSDDSLPPTYSGSGNKSVIVIDGVEHEVRIFDAPTQDDDDNNMKTQECKSDRYNKSTNNTHKETQRNTTKRSRIHYNRSNSGNGTMMSEFLRAQDEMRDLLEDLVKAQQESTTATQRAAAAINQCAQAQIASAEAVRASATALTTLASSMKDWLQRHPQRRKM